MRLRVLATAVALCAASGLGAPPCALAATADTSRDALGVLIAQGNYWQAHRRGDLAAQAWEKVLRIDPAQPDALFGMGIVLADRKDGNGAQQYLERLRSAAPDYPRIGELRRRLGEASASDVIIDDARRLEQGGQRAAAVDAYRRALAGKPADPALQLEYYQALASTPQGWDEARRGLEQLAREHADDPRYALAYAQHLTYRAQTRRTGIARLAELASDGTVGKDARRSWRQALLWLGARPSDASMYRAYLDAAGEDAAVSAKLDSLVHEDEQARERAQQDAAQTVRGKTIAAGFAALDAGDIDAARTAFSSILTSAPNDSNALGGMGIAALKREQFAQARSYLERASRSGNAARWKASLATATYWADLSEALGAQSNGDTAKAKTLFERAIALDPSDPSGQAMLGDMLLASGNAAGAEQAYRMALRRDAGYPDAIRGLVGALAAQGRGDEALVFANQLNAEQRASAGGIDRLRAEAQAAEARTALAHGDFGRARSLLEEALAGMPDDPWLRLDLAHIYVREGALATARSMMDGLLAEHPDMVDARYASALLAADMQDWKRGLAELARIPTANRTDAMALLQHRLWVHEQADLAARMAAGGDRRAALATLEAAEPVAGSEPELIGALATGYLHAGSPERALWIARQALGRAPGNPDLLLQYAGILMNAGQEAELGEAMRRLGAMHLTARQHSDFDKLKLAIVIRRADDIRLRGDLAAAYDVIAPWLAAMPESADLQAMLARLYSAAGDDRHALACYHVALRRRPDDGGLLVAALAAATSVKEFSEAENLAARLLKVEPDSPEAMAGVGRMYRAEGKLSLAEQWLRRALVAANAPAGGSGGPGSSHDWGGWARRANATPLPGTNPFAGKNAVPDASGESAPDALRRPIPILPAAASLAPERGDDRPYLPTSVSSTVPYYQPPEQPPYQTVANAVSDTADEPVPLDRIARSHAAPRPIGRGASGAFARPIEALDDSGYGSEPSGAEQSSGPAQSADEDPDTPWPLSPMGRDARRERASGAGAAAADRPVRAAASRLATAKRAKRTVEARSHDVRPYAPRPYTYADSDAQAEQPYLPPPPPSRYAMRDDEAGLAPAVDPAYRRGAAAPARRSIAESPVRGVADELAQIDRAQSSTLTAGVVFRNRDGEDGLSNLSDIETPIEGRIKAGNGHVVVKATAVALDAGTASNAPTTLSRFGLGLSSSGGAYGSQTANGVGLSVGYEARHWSGDAGTTPLGFLHPTPVGGLRYDGAITDKVAYSLEVARRAVTESLLSYAGARYKDDFTGKTVDWGGVTSNGARAQLAWDDGRSGAYANASYQFYVGRNVVTNTAFKGGGGFYTRLFRDADQTLTVGVNTTLMHYAKNESYFTYGQGGYFSPQQYVIVNLPIEWMGRNGAFTYDLKGSVGVQHYRTSSVAYFPLGDSISATASANDTNAPDAHATYPGSSKTGLSYAFKAVGEYQFAPQLTAGAMASLGNAYNYREWIAAVYVRYSFTGQGGAPAFPPSPLSSMYASSLSD
jgi:tetratricopeptide (TPR) repeat protein